MVEENTILCISLITVFNFVASQNLEGFIVDGTFAKMKDFPHSALLYIECRESADVPTQYFTCGSSILNQAIILTAAHCLENCAAKSTYVTVHVGDREKKKGLPFLASAFKIHRKYDTQTISNDIGLVKLRKRLEFGKNVRRVALMRDPPYDEAAEVAGWGWLNENPRTDSQFLMQASQRVWSRESCIETMGFIPEGTICGGALNAQSYVAPYVEGILLHIDGGKEKPLKRHFANFTGERFKLFATENSETNSFPQRSLPTEVTDWLRRVFINAIHRGDSGSGLMVRKYIQIGIVSYKIPSKSARLAMYTDVAYFYDWIKRNAKKLYCN